MRTQPLFWPSIIVALALAILGVRAVRGASLPPIPGQTKAQSPKAAVMAAAAGKPMVVVGPPLVVTNTGSVSASFQATKIQGLQAGFKYRTNPTNGAWRVLGTMAYPTNGGTVSMNYAGTNIPAIYFKAFFEFVAPPPSAY